MGPLGGGSIHHEEGCLPGPPLPPPEVSFDPRLGLSQQRSGARYLRLQLRVNMASRINWHLYHLKPRKEKTPKLSPPKAFSAINYAYSEWRESLVQKSSEHIIKDA
ncbi:hypothetical protein CDAR_99241 [Caerostris darwini]|uniref:Uncharacterized protein n=1 Tax=Caerostris darwini TaxID=1538125 RepID=A0AAV4Q7A5_9ARAC|nr:hypothetical protein CDAR_99241 [Caerostris darwini]